MKTRFLMLFAGLAFAASSASALTPNDPKFLYFAPGELTSPDGKYTLAAFKNGNPEQSVSYYYVSGGPSGIEIASEEIFEGYDEYPDVRGYGPTLSSWSTRWLGNDSETPRRVGELVGTLYLRRKSTEIVFHALNEVNGKKILSKTDFDSAHYHQLGLALMSEKVKQAGYNPETEMHFQISDESFAVVSDDPKKAFEEDRWPKTFEVEEGRLVMISGSYYVEKSGDPNSAADAEYTVVVKVFLGSDGVLKKEIVYQTAQINLN